MLTKDEILRILEGLNLKTLYSDGSVFLQQKQHGYSDDPEVGALQAKLSIMLEVASRREISSG